MAVTKISRTSRITLYITVFISIVVVVLFLVGGQTPEAQKVVPDMSQPKFTDFMLYWIYALLAITVVVLLAFALDGLLKGFKTHPKKALRSFLVLVALIGLLVITYIVGDGTLLNIPGYDGADNNPVTLKMTDMWLYSMYLMLVVTVGAILISPLLKKK